MMSPTLRYVQIRSWHVVRSLTPEPHVYRTMCGRIAVGSTVTTLPAEKSCETCLRLVVD